MSIVLSGDIHGDEYELRWRLRDLEGGLRVHEGDTLVCLGDVGLLYGDYEARDLARLLEGLPCDVVVMRGNHDARYWRDMLGGYYGHNVERRVWGGGEVLVEADRPNVLYLPDEGGLFTIEGKRCLFVPGAYSVDKWFRLRSGYPYEREEQLFPDEMDRLMEVAREGRVDYVFSHTCPLSWQPCFRDLFLPGLPQSEVDKSMEEWMDQLLDVVSPGLEGWYFGHYHDDRQIDADVPARMLMNELVRL